MLLLWLAYNKNCISSARARQGGTLHLINLNSLPDESLHHTLQHLHHLLCQLQEPVVASIQSIPFALVQIDNEAFLSVGMRPSQMMSSMRSGTSTVPASPTGISISVTIPACLAAYTRSPLANVLCDHLQGEVFWVPRKLERREDAHNALSKLLSLLPYLVKVGLHRS